MDLGNGVNKEQRLQRTKSEAEEGQAILEVEKTPKRRS